MTLLNTETSRTNTSKSRRKSFSFLTYEKQTLPASYEYSYSLYARRSLNSKLATNGCAADGATDVQFE
eukprot:scaffold258747_cov19-Prasinocladus_malaysianus.AAC.1